MTKPCRECKHYENRNGSHYCKLKQRDTSTARITDAQGNKKETGDCWQKRLK